MDRTYVETDTRASFSTSARRPAFLIFGGHRSDGRAPPVECMLKVYLPKNAGTILILLQLRGRFYVGMALVRKMKLRDG